MEDFLARLTSKAQKKTAGRTGGWEESGRFIWVRSGLSAAEGAGEPKVAKEKGHG
ncbi:hypothetical protein [Rhodoferax sp. BLA1]|uniref:hypothetical protein n=1 Tax=Rhodoferax sp. BLA1 TaxID=2576062 RepID=UPI0015D0F58B|nr:hypothetical protein [Rhodoferax sp. BLA1]